MSRAAIFGLVCTTFLMFLRSSAVPQEPERKGADTESGQLTFNNACRTCHTTKEGDNRLGPNLHNIIGRKAGSLPNYGYSSAMKGAIHHRRIISGSAENRGSSCPSAIDRPPRKHRC
jgi:cytochrome c